MAALIACWATYHASAQNLVQNPGFESTPTGGASSPGWTLDTATGTTYVNGTASGVWAVDFGAAGAAAFSYKPFTAIIRVTSGSSVLAFTGEQDSSDFLLDDVSVVAGPLPVPGGGLLSFGAAMAGYAVRRWRTGGTRAG